MRVGSFARDNVLVIAASVLALALVLGALLWVVRPWQSDPAEADVTPRESLADYSWEELSTVASGIGACESSAEAARIAVRYGLCDADGAIAADAAKPIELADGRIIEVQLVDFWHDERTDGGKAGLTFAFADAAGEYAMNHAFENPLGENADSVGGWQASDMRAWLNGEFLETLPADLRGRIVSVQKRTASVVGARDELAEAGRLAGAAQDWVCETSDKLWLFSAAELCGPVSARPDLGVDDTMVPVYAAEGAQYRLFADADVTAFAPNEALVRFGNDTAIVDDSAGEGGYDGLGAASVDAAAEASESASVADAGTAAEASDASDLPTATGSNSVVVLPCTWWLRTKMLEFGDGFWLVGTDGTPLNGVGEDARGADPAHASDSFWGPDHARGVVAGFCL